MKRDVFKAENGRLRDVEDEEADDELDVTVDIVGLNNRGRSEESRSFGTGRLALVVYVDRLCFFRLCLWIDVRIVS